MKNIALAPIQYLKEIISELKKVTWPSRSNVAKHTIIVLISSAIAMAVMAAVDFGLSRAIEYIISYKQG